MTKKVLLIFCAAAAGLSLISCKIQKAVPLSRDSLALAEIVTPDTPTQCEKYSAKELKKYLDKITGGDFKIVKESEAGGDTPAIYVGNTKKSAEISPDFNPEKVPDDTVHIKTAGDCVVINGHERRGTLYATSVFLEDCIGVKCWADDDVFIPKNPTLSVPQTNITYSPPLVYRRIDYKVGENAQNAVMWRSGILIMQNDSLWREVDDSFAIWCHSFYKVLPPKKYFKEHPEWYSEIKGKRTAEHAQLCLSNEEMAAEFIKKVKEALAKKPFARFVHVSQNDWYGYCECKKCSDFAAAHGGEQSAAIVNFANKVAEAIEKDYPDARVVTFAYQYSRRAPKGIKPRGNVWIELCSIECDFAHPLETDKDYGFTKDIIDWSKLTRNLTIWDYVTCFKNYQIPYPNLGVLADNIRFFVKNGAIGLFEQSDQTCVTGDFVRLRNWYLYKLMWNPNLDGKKLVDEFLKGYYAPEVADYLKEYLDEMSDAAARTKYSQSCYYTDTLTWMDVNTFNKMYSLMAKALAKAVELEKSDPQKYKNLSKKLRREKLPIDYVAVMNYAQLSAMAKRQNTKLEIGEDIVSLAVSIAERWKEFGVNRINQHETRENFLKFAETLPQIAKRQKEYIEASPKLSVSEDIGEFGDPETCMEIQEDRIDQCNFARNIMTQPPIYVPDKNASNGWAAKLDTGSERLRRFEVQFRGDLEKLKSPSGAKGKRKYRVYAFVRGAEKQGPNATFISYTFRKGSWDVHMQKNQKYDVYGEKYKRLDCGTIELDHSRKEASSFQFWMRIESVKKYDDILLDRIVIAAE